MPGQYDSLIPALRGSFISRNDLLAWLRALSDDFTGSSLDDRWSSTTSGGGSGASLAGDSPTRTVLNTRTGTSAAVDLNQGGRTAYNVNDKYTILVRARLQASSEGVNEASVNCAFLPINMFAGAGSFIRLGYDSTVNKSSFVFTSDHPDGSSTNVLPIPVDTGWHDFELSVHGSTLLRARIDCDPSPYAEITSKISTVDMEFRSTIQVLTAQSAQMDIDRVVLIPGLKLF